ncbi:InlB B-repeat-containing protein [Candidatus Saccharibacteria bacterium]|nr:InlB B-repeat-containing protein [Candidatus Saccharibacteria bacterium]
MSLNELDTCRTQANNIDSTGALANACDRAYYGTSGTGTGGGCRIDSDTQYGSVFFDSSTTYNWDGISSLRVPMYGAVYCCTKTSDVWVKANDISLGLGITVDSTSLARSCGSSNMQLGPKSSSYITATVPASALNQASCDSYGNCTLTVGVTSRLGNSNLATYDSYLKFKKGGSSTPCTCTCCDCNPSGCTPTPSAGFTPEASVYNYGDNKWHTGYSYYTIPSGSTSVSLYWNYSTGISVTGDCTTFHWSTTHNSTGGDEWACSWDTSKTVGSGYDTINVGVTTSQTNKTVAPGDSAWFCGTVTINSSNNSTACVNITAPEAPAEQTYTLSYNLSGGSGNFPQQSCTTTGTSCSITIHSGSPTKTDYIFANWWSGYTSYAPGGSITISADTTLYAGWTQNTHTLNYNANGGEGAPRSQTHSDANSSYTFTISSTKPTRTGYEFMGWATYNWATSPSYQPGGTITVATSTTLYAVWRAYDVATFTSNGITVTSTSLNKTSTGSDTAWRGLGNTTQYEVTVYYSVKRTNNTPTSAISKYGTKSSSNSNDSYPNNTTSSNALTNGNSQSIPVTYTISVANGNTATVCFYFKYDDKVYYNSAGTRIGSASTDTRKKCITIYNPSNNSAAFSGSVSISNGTGLSGDGTDRVGNGYRSTFTITPAYSLTRTDNFNPPLTATSNYAINATTSSYSSSHYPASATSTSNSLYNSYYALYGYTKTQSWSGSATTVDINIGASAQTRCFYLRYDSSVLYYDNDRQSGNFAGKNYACASITNPPQTATINFTGNTTAGILTANDKLTRTDSNRTGTIINHTRNTTGDDNVIGKWSNDTAAINATYTADFTHTLSRNDSSSTILGKTMNADVYWQIQYAYPATAPIWYNNQWIIPNTTWQNYTSGLDNNSATTTGTESFGASASKTITTQPKLKAAQGQILYYCQRLTYTSSSTYTTQSVTNKTDYGVSLSSVTTGYTNPLCVTLKNPLWSETNGGTYDHVIDVSATPSDTDFDATDFNKTGNDHETLTFAPTIFVNHTVTRTDNKNKPDSYDESDVTDTSGNILFGNSSNKKFWQKSIYSSGDDIRVTTNLSGYEKVIGFDTDARLVGLVNGLSPDGVKPVTLAAASKTSGSSWASTRTDGASKLTFNASGTNQYSVMAGQTRTFTIQSSVRPTRWIYTYKKINLHEYYTKDGSTSNIVTGTTTYDRIEKVPSTASNPNPTASTYPAHLESAPVTFSVTRPYNFKITNATTNSSEEIAYSSNTFTATYTIDIERENNTHQYITDPNHTDNARYVSVVTYILPANVNAASGTLATSLTGGLEATICNRFNGIAKAGSCTVQEGSHPTKLSKTSDTATFDPAKSSSVVDTVFRHVYDTDHYQLSYTTGTLTVENPDHSPLAVGEKFCTAIAIKSPSSAAGASNQYFVSNSTCRNVSKRPAFQTWGGSVITNGGIATSESVHNTASGSKIFGSWADFALIAGKDKDIKNMSSGASTISGAASTSSLLDRNPLTIANNNWNCTTTNCHKLGNSGIEARSDFLEKALVYFEGNTALDELYSLCGSGCPAGSKALIVRDAVNDLTITQNLINSDAFTQIIIIAKNINIDQSVTRLDAWLIAANGSGTGGTIDTCYNVADADLSASTCNTPLTINGVLTAGKVKFKRTSGADLASGTIAQPAEIINFSPSTMIWAYAASRFETNPRTIYVRKLPTRY